MRNTTKLKTLLQKYTVSLDLDDDGKFVLMLTDKSNNDAHQFKGDSYSNVISKAFSFLLRELKKPLE